MEQVCVQLTVLFEEPFWIGLCERQDSSGYAAGKITFGAEPKDYEVLAFLLAHWYEVPFSKPVPEAMPERRAVKPKRMQREARRGTGGHGIGTKAQEALKAQREEGKLQRRERRSCARQEEAERRFALRQDKRREKHRGH